MEHDREGINMEVAEMGVKKRRQRMDDNVCGVDRGETEDDRESMNTVVSEMGVNRIRLRTDGYGCG